MVAPASTCSAGGFSLRHDPRKGRESHSQEGGPVLPFASSACASRVESSIRSKASKSFFCFRPSGTRRQARWRDDPVENRITSWEVSASDLGLSVLTRLGAHALRHLYQAPACVWRART